ncbi:MAG: hypothetical protein IJC66_07535, partial [Kiritimatiellae bacterium]|nr:hypothetical protein [Kiritimatiellia bacterium]
YLYIGNVTNNIGAGGIKSEKGGFRFMFHKSGDQKVFINLVEPQTWSGPASDSLTADAFMIAANYPAGATYSNNIYAVDNVVWTLSGNLLVNMLTYENVLTNADVVIKHPAVMAIAQHEDYGLGRLNARSLTLDAGVGVYFGKNKSLTLAAGGATYNQFGFLGSFPEISPLQVAKTIVLTNGATLTACEPTTVTGGVTVVASAGSTTAFSGAFSLMDDDTVIRVCEGGTLDLTAARFGEKTARFSLEGGGTLVLDCAMNGTNGVFRISPDSLAGFSGGIVVNNGILMLDDIESIPAGKVITQGDGKFLLVDPEGFDASVHMDGTKVYAVSPLIVTDEAVTGDRHVGEGEVLHVLGDGLGESATLSLGAGAKVVFYRTATIGAPITSSKDVYFETLHSSVTGTVAGVWTADKPSESEVFHAYLNAPGCIILSGGGSIGSNDGKTSNIDVLHAQGNVLVTGAIDAYCDLNLDGGHLTFRDGGEWRMKKRGESLNMNTNMKGPVCLEIGSGGVVSNDASQTKMTLKLGGAAYESRLFLNGGIIHHRYAELTFADNGVLEIDSGVFWTGRRATCSGIGTGTRVILRNGMYHLAGNSTYGPCLFDGPGSVNVHISGKATLRTAGPLFIPDSTNDSPNCSWTCSEGAQLQMVGSSAPTTNLFHNFSADGLAFNFSKSAYSPNSSSYVIIEPVNKQASVGFVLSDNLQKHAKLAVTNEDVALNVSYVVPDGVTFDVREAYEALYTGFTSAVVSNLTFELGSALAFPFFGESISSYPITGTLTLPDEMTGQVDVLGEKVNTDPTIIISADGGVSAPDAGCVWSVTGVNSKRVTFGFEDDGLTFAYKTLPFAIILR